MSFKIQQQISNGGTVNCNHVMSFQIHTQQALVASPVHVEAAVLRLQQPPTVSSPLLLLLLLLAPPVAGLQANRTPPPLEAVPGITGNSLIKGEDTGWVSGEYRGRGGTEGWEKGEVT